MLHDAHAYLQEEQMIDEPIPVGIRIFVSALEGVAPQVEELRHSQVDERFAPTGHLLCPLLLKDYLPVARPQGDKPAVVVNISEEIPRTLLGLPGEMWQHVYAVDVDLERLVSGFMAFQRSPPAGQSVGSISDPISTHPCQ